MIDEYREAPNFSVSTVTPAMPRMRVSPSLFPLPFSSSPQGDYAIFFAVKIGQPIPEIVALALLALFAKCPKFLRFVFLAQYCADRSPSFFDW